MPNNVPMHGRRGQSLLTDERGEEVGVHLGRHEHERLLVVATARRLERLDVVAQQFENAILLLVLPDILHHLRDVLVGAANHVHGDHRARLKLIDCQ